MPSAVQNALLFLIDTLLNLYIFILVVRAILVYVGAHYYDPLTQFIVKCTDIFVKPLRKIIPTIKRIECATLLLIILFEILKLMLISLLSVGMPAISGLIVMAVGETLGYFVNTFFYAIIIYVVLTWIQPNAPMMFTLQQIASPVMRPIQRLIPPVSGFDLSPIFALILLQLIMILCVSPLVAYGQNIAY